jgi:hypothetical protein
MRYFVLILFFLSNAILLKCQDFWFRGKVVDTANVAIAFATITDKDYQKGTYTDENGFFEIQLQKQQSLHLSAIGYESIDFNAQQVDSNVLFVLKEKTYRLSNIEIKPRDFRKGSTKWKYGKKKKITLSTAPQFAYQAGVYFPNPDKLEGELETITFYFKNESVDTASCRLHLYEWQENTVSSFDLLAQPTFIKIPKRSGSQKVEINLLKNRIHIPNNGFLIAIEWIKTEQNTYLNTINYQGVPSQKLSVAPMLIMGIPQDNQVRMWHKNKAQWFPASLYASSKEKLIAPYCQISIKVYQ